MIYLDHHAASPWTHDVTVAVQEALGAHAADAYASSSWANPASVHAFGRKARAALERAREDVAASIRARPAEIVFTSGGTEACNLAVRGLACASTAIVVSNVEHPAVAEAVHETRVLGSAVTELRVQAGDIPSPDELSKLLRVSGARLCVVQWVNHETGTILPIPDYADVCVRHQAMLVVDGCQAWGKLHVDVADLGASAVAFGASKIGGPAGVGVLWVDSRVGLKPLLVGGTQERGRRPGTQDVLGALGLGAAARAISARVAQMPAIALRRSRLEQTLLELGGFVNGSFGERVATVTNVSFRGMRGDDLVAALDLEGVACSSGAACSSGLSTPSPVLRAMYPSEPWRASSALRFSLGPQTTDADIDGAIAAVHRVFARRK